MTMMVLEELQALLKKQCAEGGGVKKWATREGMSWSYVYDVLRGTRPPSKKILTALGMKKIRVYQAKE